MSTATALHLCAGIANLEVLEHMSRDVPWEDEILDYEFEVSDGAIEVPDSPGLGVEFDPEAARQYPGEPKDSHSLFDAEGASLADTALRCAVSDAPVCGRFGRRS
ncbi:hypothetical protein NDI56_16705 [Haloarcula sp. S1CR25-12]|uniref:Enolase C-terminal domain-containing protein n=1 Tax=Haloarcula saliterrae TaxID=2950534 RepID=A0ABU2FFK1_9EURY|nr:enolase C-terminal domain-like protein [Haloarcula sp. S1CR25-12]MDS0261041.1 hypothetical protein [Haloarcula sp. S1CR25-12]